MRLQGQSARWGKALLPADRRGLVLGKGHKMCSVQRNE